MRSEEEIWRRLGNVRAYYDAGWFQEPEHAFFGASELLWTLGFEEGSGPYYLDRKVEFAGEEHGYVHD